MYYKGKGTEKNLKEAIYWYQKAAENGFEGAQYNLALLYEEEETEKNLEKAFYWYQKVAENGYIRVQYRLALLYQEGKGVEKDFKKAFYWYQKIATNDLKLSSELDVDSDNRLLKIFEPVMRFLIELVDEIYNKYNKCHKKRRFLKENHQICKICYQAMLLHKSSENKVIDEFIEDTQINFVQESSRMKFIPYDQFENIESIGKGGFSEIYKAT